jgi:predicted ATP-dependent endonuclease of OLD family
MRISMLRIENFRGIKATTLYPTNHVVLIGDNNAGKTSILEAINLVLGPDRLNQRPVIDEHDFYAGKYINVDGEENNPHIYIEVVITELSEEQQRKFHAELEYWNANTKKLILFEGHNKYKDRFIRQNDKKNITPSDRQLFMVGITRAKKQTTIMTPNNDPCVLLPT